MSSEMRELIRKEVEQWVGITRNRDIERSARVWMEGYDAALTYCAERISALLARTEAGADEGDNVWRVPDIDYQRMYYAEQQLLALREAATPVAWRSKDFNPLFNGGFAWAYHSNPGDVGPQHEPLFTHPQDASGDEGDAARWRHVRKDGLIWRVNMLALAKDDIDILFGAKADAAVDAAMQAKEAK